MVERETNLSLLVQKSGPANAVKHVENAVKQQRMYEFHWDPMSTSQQRNESMSELDFDEEARKLFHKIGLDPKGSQRGGGTSGYRSLYNPMDPIFKRGSSTIFVGNQQAAQNAQLLQKEGITHIINCTDSMPLFHPQSFKYYRFNISFFPSNGEEQLREFLRPMFEFVDSAFAEQGNVLVHCLAGAHRAGTTGCLLLMHLADLPDQEAIRTAKRLRPVIDPIGRFPDLLRRFNAMRQTAGQKSEEQSG